MGYRERYNHRRKMGYSPEKARRMAKSGCYIATAVYGSYDCPEVWTLRRYRDNKLATSLCGMAFIRIYYFFSPMLVKMFGKRDWFQTFWRTCLNRFVAKLNAAGFSNEPYSDKQY